MYKESDSAAMRGPDVKLKYRLLFHNSHKLNDEKRLMEFHQKLEDVLEDQVGGLKPSVSTHLNYSLHWLRSTIFEVIIRRLLTSTNVFFWNIVSITLCMLILRYAITSWIISMCRRKCWPCIFNMILQVSRLLI
jgi:intraflagellar transport protein 56